MTTPGATGAKAEAAARAHLEQQGLTLLTGNFRVPAGEIDLVMADGETVVFVEVRYRRSEGFGGAIESVGHWKRKRLIHAAMAWLQRQRGPEPPARFDVIALSGDAAEPEITWIRDAFVPGEWES